MNAHIYKDHRLFLLQNDIAPDQKAVFSFDPSIWIGVVGQIEKGQVMNAAMPCEISTEFSLEGIIK